MKTLLSRRLDLLHRIHHTGNQARLIQDELLHRLTQQKLSVAPGLVAADEGQLQVMQDGADVLELQLHRSLAALTQPLAQLRIEFGLGVALLLGLQQKHLEI